MRKEQEEVAEFMEEHELGGTTPFRLLDLVSEIGESEDSKSLLVQRKPQVFGVARDATKSSEYGERPQDLDVKKDEIGDVLFSLLAVSNDLGIDAEEAFEEAIEKYEDRIAGGGDPGSGSHS
ncbi:MAG: MazG nucleotide pyrophosphohydrolase domain-containing protein [Candidatus Nanohalobium sp.]